MVEARRECGRAGALEWVSAQTGSQNLDDLEAGRGGEVLEGWEELVQVSFGL